MVRNTKAVADAAEDVADLDGVELRDLSRVAAAAASSSPSRPSSASSMSAAHRFGLDDEVRFQKASVYVTNAMRGRLTTTDNIKLYLFFHSAAWNMVYITSVIVMCALIVFENPSTLWVYLVPDDEPLLQIPFGELREDGTPGATVPVALSLSMDALEILLCGVFVYDFLMRKELFHAGDRQLYYKYTKKERKSNDRKVFDPLDPELHLADLPINVEGGDPLITDLWTNFELILVCIVGGNALVCLVTTAVYSQQVVPHFGRMVRPFFFLVKMVNVRQIGTSIIRSIPKILDVVILLLLTILMFAIVAFLMFAGVTGRYPAAESIFQELPNDTCAFSMGYDNDVNASEFDSFVPYCSTWSAYCRDYFNSVAHAFIHLFILVTTANFPDVMNPYTECSGWTFAFFAIYIVLSLYTFLSLVLAVVYNLYQRVASAQIARRRAKAQRCVWKAYELLSEPLDPTTEPAVVSAEVSRKILAGQGMSMSRPRPRGGGGLVQARDFAVGDVVDRGVVHFHNRYRVHTWVQWLRAEVTAVHRDHDDGSVTGVDLKYLLGNGQGPVEPLTPPSQDLTTESGVPVGHVRFARGVSLVSWLRLRQMKALRRQSSVWCTQFELAMFSMVHDACRPGAEQPADLTDVPEHVRSAASRGRAGSIRRGSVQLIATARVDDDNFATDELPEYDVDGDRIGKKAGILGSSAAASMRRFTSSDDFENFNTKRWDSKEHDFVPDGYEDDYLLDLSQFEHLVSFTETKLCPVDSETPQQKVKCPCYHRTRLWLSRKVVATQPFSVVVDLVIILYAVMLIVEYARIIVSPWLDTLQAIFLWFFLVEICTVMYAKTARGYFLNLDKPNTPVNILNLLDAIAIFASVFIDLLQPAGGVQLSFVSLFRVIRMVRILRSLTRFKVIFRTLKHLLPALARYVLLVFIIFYVFAAVGMELFAKLLDNDPNATTYLYVEQSAFGTNLYWGQNFDTFGSAVLVLFAQMVVNNWPVVMEGCVAAYHAVYYKNINATSREYAYFYDITHTSGCASAFYDPAWVPSNFTHWYNASCLGSINGRETSSACLQTFSTRQAAMSLCENYGITMCSAVVKVDDHWEHRYTTEYFDGLTLQMDRELDYDVESTESLLLAQNQANADTFGNLVQSDEDKEGITIWLMDCVVNDFYFTVQQPGAADFFISFAVRLYFIVFYFFCVLTVMNVIIAVFLDFYNVEQDRHRALVQESLVPWRKFLNFQVQRITGVKVDKWVIHKAQHSSGLSIFSTTAEFPLFAHLYKFPDEEAQRTAKSRDQQRERQQRDRDARDRAGSRGAPESKYLQRGGGQRGGDGGGGDSARSLRGLDDGAHYDDHEEEADHSDDDAVHGRKHLVAGQRSVSPQDFDVLDGAAEAI